VADKINRYRHDISIISTYRSITNRDTDACTVCEMNAVRVAPIKQAIDIWRTVITLRLAMIYVTVAQRAARHLVPHQSRLAMIFDLIFNRQLLQLLREGGNAGVIRLALHLLSFNMVQGRGPEVPCAMPNFTLIGPYLGMYDPKTPKVTNLRIYSPGKGKSLTFS